MAARQSFPATLFIRFLIGLLESASFPCLYHFFPIWIPSDEKTFLIPAIISGLYLGPVVGLSLSGVIVASSWKWPAVFYLFGTVGLLWFPLYALMVHESPEVHPHITAEELRLIQTGE